MPRIRTEADHAPRAVFRVTQEREPGRTIVIRHRSVIEGENPTNYILTYAEGQGDLLGDTGTSPRWIALLHINNGTNDIRVGTFWPRLRAALWRKQQMVFALNQSTMKIQQSRWFECDRRSQEPIRPDPHRTESSDQPI